MVTALTFSCQAFGCRIEQRVVGSNPTREPIYSTYVEDHKRSCVYYIGSIPMFECGILELSGKNADLACQAFGSRIEQRVVGSSLTAGIRQIPLQYNR